jgi:DNA replication protein DnaC
LEEENLEVKMEKTFSTIVDRLRGSGLTTAMHDEEIKRAEQNDWNRRIGRHIANLENDMGPRYKYAECKFENYSIYDRMQSEIHEAVSKIDPNRLVETGGGIVLYGNPGTGKDHLIAALMYKAIATYGHACRWINGRAWFGRARDMIIKEDKPERIMLKAETSPAILTIADPIPLNGAHLSNWNLDLLYQVIDERYRSRRPTCVTINLHSEDAIRDHLSGPVADRLFHNATLLKCTWQSFRRKDV